MTSTATAAALPTDDELSLVWNRLANVDDGVAFAERGEPGVDLSRIRDAILGAIVDGAAADLADVGRIAVWVRQMRERLDEHRAVLDVIEEATLDDLEQLARLGALVDYPRFDRHGHPQSSSLYSLDD